MIHTVNYKNVTIKMSDGSIIKGKVNIPELHQRLSDFFRYSQEQFLTVVSEESSEDSQKVFLVNKNHIMWAGTETDKA